jgi:putative ABC transport system permease protein
LVESVVNDIRYSLRGIRRSPLFAASVAATIGLGLGVLCSAFTILNTYLLRPIDLPDAHQLYSLSWDTETTQRHRFTLADFDNVRRDGSPFSGLVAARDVAIMQDEVSLVGLLVTGNYFQVLGGRPALGRWISPADAAAPGSAPVVVLSDATWRTRYAADPAIVGKAVTLGRQRFDVVGVAPPAFGLRGELRMSFWAPLTMAGAFPGIDLNTPALVVVGRLREGATETQARAWFDVWLRQQFTAESDDKATAARLEFEGRRFAVNTLTVTLLALLGSAFSLVLLVACANVTNLLLARALGRQREIGVRLALGASRWRVARQLTIESLVLAVPAAAVGLALTLITARVFPPLIVSTIPKGIGPIEGLMVPLEPDIRVMALLFVAAIASAVLVTLAPAVRVGRMNLVWASKGESAMDTRRSRLRTGLVAMQIGACVLFIVGASGLIEESQRLANPDPGIAYERVTDVRLAPSLRSAVAVRLAADPAIERVAAAWRAPLDGPLQPIGVIASQTRTEQTAGFMVVSPEYFPLFDIRVVRGRAFTALEADDGAPVVLVSEATARTLWPGLDPIGQTLDLVPPRGRRANRRPAHTSVRVIGVTENVVNGLLMDGVDATCVYFATGLNAPGELSILVRTRGDVSTARASVAAAVNAVEPDASFQTISLRVLLGLMAWAFQAFSVTASLLGAVGLVLAFSGTYAVVAFLVTQRRREFGIRMALGATVRQIVSGMLGDTLRTAAIGLGAGLAVSMSLVRFFSGTIPIIPSYSLRTYVVGTSIVLVATVIAALLPSLRAARIDPSKALRVD